MSNGLKIYAASLMLLVFSLIIIYGYEGPKVSALNEQLSNNEVIKSFPYRFKVLRINDRTAVLNSPVSTEMPCGQVIPAMFPEIKGKSLLSDEYQQARIQLAEVQTLIENLVKADPDIDKVSWELDKNWLLQHGINLNPF
jgi:hypothetical protein